MHYSLPESCWVALHLLQYHLHGRVAEDLLHLRVVHGRLPPGLGVILSDTSLQTRLGILY